VCDPELPLRGARAVLWLWFVKEPRGKHPHGKKKLLAARHKGRVAQTRRPDVALQGQGDMPSTDGERRSRVQGPAPRRAPVCTSLPTRTTRRVSQVEPSIALCAISKKPARRIRLWCSFVNAASCGQDHDDFLRAAGNRWTLDFDVCFLFSWLI
jgi:hypothetical protein